MSPEEDITHDAPSAPQNFACLQFILRRTSCRLLGNGEPRNTRDQQPAELLDLLTVNLLFNFCWLTLN